MIQDTMRKHKRLFLAILLVLIVGPFVLWGGSFGSGSSNRARGVPVVATVGKTPILAEDFRQALAAERQSRARFGDVPTPEQLLADGTALKIVESLVERELLNQEIAKEKFVFDQAYLAEQIKDWPEFKDETGKFDPKRWNQTVEDDRVNWPIVYAAARNQAGQRLILERASASGRVLDSDLKKQFEKENTKLEIRYLALDTPIEPTEEQIKTTYDKDPTIYQIPEKRRAEFVAVPLRPPRPAVVDELVARARAGEDFAELAKQYSQGPTKDDGGDIGWLTNGPGIPPHQLPIFDLAVGAVSDPMEGPAAYYIYKVEEERVNAETQQREIRVREILIKSTLSDDERAGAEAKAKQLAAKAKETGDLAAAAAEAGLDVRASGEFSIESDTIENVDAGDAFAFARGLAAVPAGQVSDVIPAPGGLYVAKVTEVQPPVPQPFEAVRDRVREDTIAQIRRSPERAQELAKLASTILEKAKTLEEVKAQFPEIQAEIKTIPPSTLREYDFTKGPIWNWRDVVDTLEGKQPGELAGPISDFQGVPYLAEVISRTPPDEKTWAEVWPQEQKRLREMALAQARNARLQDYLTYARERSLYQIDQPTFIQTLGILREEEQTPSAPGAPSSAAADGSSPPASADAPPATSGDSAPVPSSDMPPAAAGETIETPPLAPEAASTPEPQTPGAPAQPGPAN